MIYDIIGDIHGQAEKLRNLLKDLGYTLDNGLYQQIGHTLIFVGDFIDRGPHQKEALDIVKPLVSSGYAQAVMGNHEYNAICYHTKSTQTNSDEWLRPHTKKKTFQHQAFLNEYPLHEKQTNEIIEWFKTLPLYLDLGDFRIIHACWDQHAITKARNLELLSDNNRLNLDQLEASATKGTEQFEIIETLLKGPELSGVDTFLDKDDIERNEVRTRWWGSINHESTYRDLAFWYDTEKVTIPGKRVQNHKQLPRYDDTLPPVFFGHYWLNHELIGLQQSNVACLDYSAGKNGPLVAYRFNTNDSKTPLSVDNFYYSF